jgi:ferredoxin
MKAVVDEDRCRGHGVCCTICPEVFELNNDGYAEVLVSEVPSDLAAEVRSAAANCPERAISLSRPAA